MLMSAGMMYVCGNDVMMYVCGNDVSLWEGNRKKDTDIINY